MNFKMLIDYSKIFLQHINLIFNKSQKAKASLHSRLNNEIDRDLFVYEEMHIL